jgi:cystathionine beta-synthase
VPELVTITAHAKVGEGIDTMQRYGISQLPVVRDGQCESLADVIGSLQDRALLERVFGNPDSVHEDVAAAMQPPLPAGRGVGDARRGVRDAHRWRQRRGRGTRGKAGRRAHAFRPSRVPGPPG